MERADAALTELRAADELLAAGDADGATAARERACELLRGLQATTAVFDADAGTWHFGHEPAGPAGAAMLRLVDGVTLSFDLADPSQLLALTAPAGEAATSAEGVRRVLDGLIGSEAAALLGAEPVAGAPAAVPFDPARKPARDALGRLAALDRARALDEDSNGVWPLWAAEAAVLCSQAAGIPGCDVRARAEAATCAETVLAVAEATPAEAVRARLAELLPALRRLADSDADRALLARAGRALPAAPRASVGTRRGWTRAGLAEAFAPSHPRLLWTADASRSKSVPRDPVRARPSATFPVSEYFESYGLSSTRRARVYWSDGSGALEVCCHTAPGAGARVTELWVRAFSEPDYAFLDSAPLAIDRVAAPDEDGLPLACARLALPPGLAHDLLLLDITPKPAEPPADSRLALLRRAARAGMQAAAAERLGDDDKAPELWQACAALWRRAGAELQRLMAEAYEARARDRVGDGGGERLREQLGARSPASAWRLELERAATPAFVAELARPEDVASG